MELALAGAASAIGSAVVLGLAPVAEAEPSKDCAYAPCGDIVTARHVAELRSRGLTVIDGVLSVEALAAVHADLAAQMKQGELDCAGYDRSVARDSLAWVRVGDVAADAAAGALATPSDKQGLLHAVRLLRGLGSEVEWHDAAAHQAATAAAAAAGRPPPPPPRTLLVPSQVQWARYGAGPDATSPTARAAEAPQRDAETHPFFQMGLFGWLAAAAARHRCLTAVLFLNGPTWDCTLHGGALRCHLGADAQDRTGATATETVDVEPLGGRLVLYDARAVLHEVRPADLQRDALTLWLLDADSELSAVAAATSRAGVGADCCLQ